MVLGRCVAIKALKLDNSIAVQSRSESVSRAQRRQQLQDSNIDHDVM
jgi:hypothetical protein